MSFLKDIGSRETASIHTTTSISSTSTKDVAKKIWCESQWTNLSCQARNLGLPTLPYFDPKTMLLSKEINERLWKQLSRLYSVLGAEKAPYATPVMVEGGEVKWHSYLGESKGQEADIFNKSWEAGWIKG